MEINVFEDLMRQLPNITMRTRAVFMFLTVIAALVFHFRKSHLVQLNYLKYCLVLFLVFCTTWIHTFDHYLSYFFPKFTSISLYEPFPDSILYAFPRDYISALEACLIVFTICLFTLQFRKLVFQDGNKWKRIGIWIPFINQFLMGYYLLKLFPPRSFVRQILFPWVISSMFWLYYLLIPSYTNFKGGRDVINYLQYLLFGIDAGANQFGDMTVWIQSEFIILFTWLATIFTLIIVYQMERIFKSEAVIATPHNQPPDHHGH